ncbi:MAG: hypothetical protein C0498_05305 [Anaerolinea sp.]|nr:hypothetical protein [Anaerolinea sp.]
MTASARALALGSRMRFDIQFDTSGRRGRRHADAEGNVDDWLLERQPRIEAGLARRHLRSGSLVLYDLTSTYVEGRHCPLAAHGHSRDGRPDRAQIGRAARPLGRRRAQGARPPDGRWAPGRQLQHALGELKTLARNRVVLPGADEAATFAILTEPTAFQVRALELIGVSADSMESERRSTIEAI